MNPTIKYSLICVLTMLSVIKTTGQQMSMDKVTNKMNVSYTPFIMASGDQDFLMLQNKIPESLGFYFLRHPSIKWIENDLRFENEYIQQNQNIQASKSKYSEELNQEFIKKFDLKYIIEGSFSEFNGRLDIYIRLHEVKSNNHFNLDVIMGSYENIAELIKESAIKIENKINELNNEITLKNIGILCYKNKRLTRSKVLNNLGNELAVSLSSKVQSNQYLVILPYRQTRYYCEKDIDEPQVMDELNADAIVTGQIISEGNSNVTVETVILIKGEPHPLYLNSITEKTYNYFGIEEKLVRTLNNLLKASIDESGNWNIEFLKFESDNYTDYQNEANRYAKLDETEIAVYLYNKALKINPRLYEVYNDLAILKNKQEKFEEAVELAQYALELNPNFLDSYLTLGNAYLNLGNYEMALETFRLGNRIKPEDIDIQLKLGLTYLYMGNYKDAISKFETVVDMDPDNVEVDRYLGQAYSYLRKDETSKVYYEKFLDNNPDDIATGEELSYKYIKSGVKLFQQKDYEKALIDFEKAAKFSENELNYDNIRNTLNYLGDFQKADEYIHKGLDNKIYDSEVFNTQANSLVIIFTDDMANNIPYAYEAIKNYELYLETNINRRFTTYGDIGLVHDYLGDKQKASVYYEMAYTEAKKSGNIIEVLWILNNLADYYFDSQNFEKSIMYGTEVLDVDPYFLVSYLTLSDSYLVTGDLKNALIQLQKLNKLLNDRNIQKREYNQKRWWWAVGDEVIFLDNIEMKRSYSLYKLALAYYITNNEKEAKHQISNAQEIYKDSSKSINKLIRKDLDYFLTFNQSYSAIIDDFIGLCNYGE